jgi:hypothetical protein
LDADKKRDIHPGLDPEIAFIGGEKPKGMSPPVLQVRGMDQK